MLSQQETTAMRNQTHLVSRFQLVAVATVAAFLLPGGVARAAEKLHLSSPTISAQIHELEGVLGDKLFERRGRSLVLTEVGQRYGPRLAGWFLDDGMLYYPAPFERLTADRDERRILHRVVGFAVERVLQLRPGDE